MSDQQLQEIKSNFRGLSVIDKVLAPISVFVIAGWVIHWVSGGTNAFGLFSDWFQTLSFFGALTVAVLVNLRIMGKQFLPLHIDRRSVAIASLVPVVGYLFEIITSLAAFLTIGGSIALAYISATTYWRKHLPSFATEPLGSAASQEGLPSKAAGDTSAASGTDEASNADAGSEANSSSEAEEQKKEREEAASPA